MIDDSSINGNDMSDSKKNEMTDNPSEDMVADEATPVVAIPKGPTEKFGVESTLEDVKETMLIKRPDDEDDEDSEKGGASEDEQLIVTLGNGEKPLLDESVRKPGIDYLGQVAQDRRPLEGTKAHASEKAKEAEQTRIIDRSDIGREDGKEKKKTQVHVGKAVVSGKKKGADGDEESMTVEEIAAKYRRKAKDLTETVNLPRGADAAKAIAKLAEDMRREKKVTNAIDPSEDGGKGDEEKGD